MLGYVYSPLNASEFDLHLTKISREEAAKITGCKRLPEDVNFWATDSRNMVLFHTTENNFSITNKIDDNGVAVKCFTDSQMNCELFPASRYWG